MDQAIWQVFGRLHILMLHFPVALVLAALFVEMVPRPGTSRRVEPDADGDAQPARRRASTTGATCLLLGAIGAGLSAWTGWVYATNDFPGDTALDLHRWSGVASASVAGVALVLAIPALRGRARLWYRLALLLSAGGVALTGHLGGELVHGKNFVLAPLRAGSEGPHASLPETTPPERPQPTAWPGPVSYGFDIVPILEANCYSCHAERRKKAGVRVDSAEHLDELLIPGNPERSLLLEVLLLPESDSRHMPKDDPPLSPDQIDTIRRWIGEMRS